MDFSERLSLLFYYTDVPTACMPARADAIYTFFFQMRIKVCKLPFHLAAGSYLSLRYTRVLEILTLWRARALQDPEQSHLITVT